MREILRNIPLGLLSKTPRGRMLRGVLANLYDKGAVTLVQLLSIPVLTIRWGVEGYGIWLMLLTVPTYIALSDFGIGTAAGVEITINVADGRLDKALEVLQSTWAFISTVVTGIALIAILAAVILFWGNDTSIGQYSGRDLTLAVTFIVLYSVVMAQMSILTVVFRATHKFAGAIIFAGSLILIEGLALIISAGFGFGLVMAAGLFLSIRIAGFFLFFGLLIRKEPWVRFGFGNVKKETLKKLINPSLAALSLILANALALQGALLTLGWTAGPAAVAVFGAVRTITRAPLQLSGLVLRPSIPELTRAQISGNSGLLNKLVRTNVFGAILATGPFFMVFLFSGQYLLNIISKGNLEAPVNLFILLSGATVANAVWMAIASPLIAINRQAAFAYWYLALSAGVAVTPIFFADKFGVGVGTAMLLAELTIFGVVILASRLNVTKLERKKV